MTFPYGNLGRVFCVGSWELWRALHRTTLGTFGTFASNMNVWDLGKGWQKTFWQVWQTSTIIHSCQCLLMWDCTWLWLPLKILKVVPTEQERFVLIFDKRLASHSVKYKTISNEDMNEFKQIRIMQMHFFKFCMNKIQFKLYKLSHTNSYYSVYYRYWSLRLGIWLDFFCMLVDLFLQLNSYQIQGIHCRYL